MVKKAPSPQKLKRQNSLHRVIHHDAARAAWLSGWWAFRYSSRASSWDWSRPGSGREACVQDRKGKKKKGVCVPGAWFAGRACGREFMKVCGSHRLSHWRIWAVPDDHLAERVMDLWCTQKYRYLVHLASLRRGGSRQARTKANDLVSIKVSNVVWYRCNGSCIWYKNQSTVPRNEQPSNLRTAHDWPPKRCAATPLQR